MILAAGLLHGGVARHLEQSCRRCQPKPDETDAERAERLERRARWGCDAELEHAVLEVECWVCRDDPDDACPHCKGTGTHPIRRCPWSVVDGTALQVVEGLAFLDVGVLPAPGGWGDQAATWWDATVIAMQERAEYRARDAERRRRELERKQR